jgi:hypothetical protein
MKQGSAVIINMLIIYGMRKAAGKVDFKNILVSGCYKYDEMGGAFGPRDNVEQINARSHSA